MVFVPQLHIKALVRLQKQDGSLALPDAFWPVRAKQLEEQPRGSLMMEGGLLRVTDATDNATLASFELLQRVRPLPLKAPCCSIYLFVRHARAGAAHKTPLCRRVRIELRLSLALGDRRGQMPLTGNQKHPYAMVDGTRTSSDS